MEKRCSRRRWSKAEEQRLRVLWSNGRSGREIGALLRRTEAAVLKRAQDLDLPTRKNLWTDAEDAELQGRCFALIDAFAAEHRRTAAAVTTRIVTALYAHAKGSF